MAIANGGQRPFPAVVIVVALFLVCLVPGQLWIAHLLPGIAGLAKIKASLIIRDISVPMPIVDLILVPGLFILFYLVVILIYRGGLGRTVWGEIAQRFWAVFSGLFILLFCVALGGLISYLLQDHLTKDVRNAIDSLGANTEINLPYTGYKAIYLHGNLIALVCFVIGVALCIGKIKKAPVIRRTVKLTREQRMTPYQRMLREKRQQGSAAPDRSPNRSPSLCRSQPLRTIEPEAVNYRPL